MPMRPYERRLSSEHRDMKALAQSSSMIDFTTHGLPPTRYDIVLRCKGLRQFGKDVVAISEHWIQIVLDSKFPLLPPIVVWKSPIFHPNIKPPHVCIGNIWYPAMSLAQFTVSLCEMVQYKSFNVYSTLNDEAADWVIAVLNNDLGPIPVDPRPIMDLDFSIDVTGKDDAAAQGSSGFAAAEPGCEQAEATPSSGDERQ